MLLTWHLGVGYLTLNPRQYSPILNTQYSILMAHPQILVTWNFRTNHDFVPWIAEQLIIGEEFQQFSRDNKYVRVPGKLSEVYSKVLLFPNPGDNIHFLVKVRDTFIPLFLHILGHCPLDWRTTGQQDVFLAVFQAPWYTCCSWKTVRTLLQCVVVFLSRGQSHK